MPCPHSDLAQVVMLAAVFTTVVQSSVIRRSTIENPCQTDSTSPLNGTFHGLDAQIRATITAARTANTTCEALKTTLVQGQYLTALEISNIEAMPINITGLTAAYNDADMSQANKIAHLKEDYTVISKHILYIENATSLARILGENVRKSLANARHSIQILLCHVDSALRSQGSPPTDSQKPSVPQVKIDADSKSCSKYIYALAKTTQKFLGYVVTKYERFANSNKG